METENVRCGFVTVTGRPNTGKSTLVNTLVGEKISITTEKPQTTRHRIRGILDHSDAQMIFLDGPGVHEPLDSMGEHLLSRARKAWGEGDLVLFVFDAHAGWGKGDERIAGELTEIDAPVILVPNKIDRLEEDIEKIRNRFSDRNIGEDCVPVSGLKNTNTDRLIDTIKTYLPLGPRLYPGENSTDRNRRFQVSEIVREKAMRVTHDEVPHSLAVVVETIEPGNDPDVTVIEATIYVERESQRGIIIGKGGEKVKAIGSKARQELTELFDTKIYLDLTVRVLERWTDDEKKIRKLEQNKTGQG